LSLGTQVKAAKTNGCVPSATVHIAYFPRFNSFLIPPPYPSYRCGLNAATHWLTILLMGLYSNSGTIKTKLYAPVRSTA
jgi:hypothetical protein